MISLEITKNGLLDAKATLGTLAHHKRMAMHTEFHCGRRLAAVMTTVMTTVGSRLRKAARNRIPIGLFLHNPRPDTEQGRS